MDSAGIGCGGFGGSHGGVGVRPNFLVLSPQFPKLWARADAAGRGGPAVRLRTISRCPPSFRFSAGAPEGRQRHGPFGPIASCLQDRQIGGRSAPTYLVLATFCRYHERVGPYDDTVCRLALRRN